MEEVNKDDIRIIQLTPEDWQKLRDLRLRALKEEPTAFMSTYEEGLTRPEDLWRKSLENPWYFFAQSGESIVGSVFATFEENPKVRHIANVYGMYMAPEARGQGAGKMLIGRLIDEIRKDPMIVKISLNVYTTQIAAHEMYQKLGFKQVGFKEKEMLVDGNFIDEYEMELFIK